MERLWRFLPEEILETNVLPHLPIASLCRFRAVSKKWQAWISHRDFAARHALATSPEDYVLITEPKYRPGDNGFSGWDVVDVVNNKVFTLADDFLAGMEGYRRRIMLAADGGLFLLEYRNSSEGDDEVFLVCNPVVKSVKLLPHSPGFAAVKTYESVVMSTDRVSMEYEIRALHQDEGDFRTYAVEIYESRTGSWRKVEHATAKRSQEYWSSVSKYVKADVFYRLYREIRQSHFNLVAYDEATSGTSNLGFRLPVNNGGDCDGELAVSGRQLYYVMKTGLERTEFRSVEIFEVHPVQRKCIKCAEMPRKFLAWLYGDDLDAGYALTRHVEPVMSTGCASSIMICSCVGRCVGYDLVEKSWHLYSDNNLLQVFKKSFKHSCPNLFSSSFCLSFCPL